MRCLARCAAVLAVMLAGTSANADYLVVSRKATIRAEPSGDSESLGRVESGTTLQLIDGDTQDGYYHISGAGVGSGWVYRTFVRRYAGDAPGNNEGSTTGGTAGSGPAACDPPFGAIAQRHPIDDRCGLDGGGKNDAKIQESRAKNNLCAPGAATPITFDTLVSLQRAAETKDIPFGSSNRLPPDRSVLRNLLSSSGTQLGEGKVVSFVGFIKDAHFSNVSKGETVNCNVPGKENNDIHVALATTVDEDDDCNTVTAEIIPHLRPAAWTRITETQLARPVKITGQLFFDASHKPCTGSSRPSPQRASLWEIHPVYGVWVCKSKEVSSCRGSDESSWIPLEQWVNREDEFENE